MGRRLAIVFLFIGMQNHNLICLGIKREIDAQVFLPKRAPFFLQFPKIAEGCNRKYRLEITPPESDKLLYLILDV